VQADWLEHDESSLLWLQFGLEDDAFMVGGHQVLQVGCGYCYIDF
jgi:hypothetical protein